MLSYPYRKEGLTTSGNGLQCGIRYYVFRLKMHVILSHKFFTLQANFLQGEDGDRVHDHLRAHRHVYHHVHWLRNG
jgi:hypothetical protein